MIKFSDLTRRLNAINFGMSKEEISDWFKNAGIDKDGELKDENGEKFKTEKTNDYCYLYHLTNANGLTTLNPRAPDPNKTIPGREDTKTKRISFGSSIEKCLEALNLTTETATGYYIYKVKITTDDLKNLRIFKSNDTLSGDASKTGEIWSLDSINVHKVGQIFNNDIITDSNKKISMYSKRFIDLQRKNIENVQKIIPEYNNEKYNLYK